MIWKGRRIVVSNEIMIRISLIDARVLTQNRKTNGVTSWLTARVLTRKGKTTGVTSCLTLVEVVLSNVVINFVILVITNVEDVFNNDALLGTKMFAM